MSAYIFTGHFGSGKTEISINYALGTGAEIIVDLDIVNPYFRTADASERLAARGVRVIAPRFAGTNLDIPALSGDIGSAFLAKRAVFDVGGDEDGARALGRYRDDFKAYEMYLVVNTKRPETRTAGDILKMLRQIELASRLKVTALINNTNLGGETDADMVLSGLKTVRAAAESAGLPILFTAVKKDLAGAFAGVDIMPIDLFLKPPF